MDRKILYIGNKLSHTEGGADVVNLRNIKLLFKIFGEKNVHFFELKNNSVLEKLQFYIGGINKEIENAIITFLNQNQDIGYVFLSQSTLGRIAKKIKKRFGDRIKVITFFHNIEKHYAREYIKVVGLKGYYLYVASAFNEKLSVKYSDTHILLNSRDSECLYKEYKVSSNIILPVSCEDKFLPERILTSDNQHKIFLFVGVAFFANLNGIEWFMNKVMSNVKGKLIIVGKGMEQYKDSWQSDRVEVHGFVEDISEFYYKSSVVIAPIFVGGGMKTKTAEALMYGKTIVGTKEAFEGYIKDNRAMIECNTDEEFIFSLNTINNVGFNNISREIFINNYSNESLLLKFKKIFIST